jgi:rod shape-determining protein MreC
MIVRFLGRKRKLITLLGVVSVLAAVLTSGWRGGPGLGLVEEGVMLAAGPVLAAADSAKGFAGGLYDFLLGWRGLREENRRLKEEISLLRRAAEQRREKEQAYDRLSALLEFRKGGFTPSTAAAVIGHDATNLFDTVLIDKGTADGLSPGMAVATPAGVVGKTIKVYRSTARVLLLSDRSSGIAAIVQRTRDQGIVRGLGGGTCEMKYLSRQADIEVGDEIVTSGMAGIFPKGMLLGRIVAVRRGGDLLQNVSVSPTAALEKLEEVVVYTGGSGEAPE